MDAGAAYLGFNFFPRSPRSVSPPEARDLAAEVPPGVAKVGLFVDPDDATLDAVTGTVPLDMIQLHGRETPARVAEVRARYGLPVMKAVGLGSREDLAKLEGTGADQILVDARPAPGGPLPGGNGVAFDWRLIEGWHPAAPWMLAGGLTPDNVAEAIARTSARQVDVASGVESAPGQKDPELIRAFLAACP